MNYRDTLVTCQECSKQFVFTVEKQRQMADRGAEIKTPEMCKSCTEKVTYGGKVHGRIKWFSPEKGFGFIIADSGGEVFVHRNGVPLTEEGKLPLLEEGQEVLFETLDSPKGPQAVQVTLYPG